LARGPKAITKKCIQTAKSRQNKVHWTARKYATVLADWIEENVAAIHASEFSIHHPIGFAGQSDALIDYKKNGNLCILDFKTSGSSKPKPDAWLDNYRLQLSSYAWGLEQQTGIKPAMGLIVIARENGYQVVELNTLELAGGRILFEERLNQFKAMLA
jgi:ATP-dependent exoDNAse (exonuclease V) beta subunit